MKLQLRRVFLSAMMLVVASGKVNADEQTVSFSRDVLPILSDRCFHCHGPDASHREADLRLDLRDEAIRDRGGYAALVPGDAAASAIIARVISTDPDLLMPPADSHRKPLNPDEIAVLRRWVNQGAVWGKHWAFERPAQVEPPLSNVHPVDAFILDRLMQAGLSLSPPASGSTLRRRLSFDLIGLPPSELTASFHTTSVNSPASVSETVAQTTMNAIPEQNPEWLAAEVDRLLTSSHYGERMAMWWLDAARYSDTDGFQADATRTNWPWRDWVVDAFNANMPFDQFTIEQFAGDLLPDATAEQQLATCFHRNHMTNGEGGRDPEESRVDYVIDRTNTMGTVWLGLTLGCCQCHSHKFDPISQREYYQLSAFFNSIDEDGKAGSGARPFMKYKSPYAARAVQEAKATVEVRREWQQAALKSATSEFESWLTEQLRKAARGFRAWHSVTVHQLESVEGTQLQSVEDNVIQATGPNPFQDDYRLTFSTSLPRVTGLRLEVLPDDAPGGTSSRGSSGLFILTDVKLQLRKRGSTQLRDIEFDNAVASKERVAKGRAYGLVKDTLDDDPRNGWMLSAEDARDPQTAVFALKQPLAIAQDDELLFVMLHRSTDGDANIARFRISLTDQPGNAVRSLDPMPLEQLSASGITDEGSIEGDLREALLQQFLSDHDRYQTALAVLRKAQTQLADCQKAADDLNVMVLAERKEQRKTFVLTRGVWDAHGDEVTSGFPAVFIGADATPNNHDNPSRLELARWIVSRDNPLTARVIVNQLWQMLFGDGLVRTPDDFGLQGERPTHPELLDWLAVELMNHDWDIQHVLRLIVTSRTYQQSSEITGALRERDPENRLLARQTRFRLPAWMIRDSALACSGLMNPAIGGPPMMPYQPEGVWEEIFMGRFTYQPSLGEAQYRRTLYAFWRRSSAPTFLFDSAQRRVCEVGRRQTNTPLQALTLLNDESMLESARELAHGAMNHDPSTIEQLDWLGRKVLCRPIAGEELNVLKRQFETTAAIYEKTPAEAQEILSVGQYRPMVPTSRQVHQAALMAVAEILLNLDEAITRE